MQARSTIALLLYALANSFNFEVRLCASYRPASVVIYEVSESMVSMHYFTNFIISAAYREKRTRVTFNSFSYLRKLQ